MTTQTQIVQNEMISRACKHTNGPTREVVMCDGEMLKVCFECWDLSLAARRAAR